MGIGQLTFNPSIWTSGGTCTRWGCKGYTAGFVLLDSDGVTGWAIDELALGFARFNVTTGAIIAQGQAFAGTGNGIEQMVVQDDAGFYYAATQSPPVSTILYKSHVASGPSNNIWNGYMTVDGSVTFANGGIRTWHTNLITKASDGNRYLIIAQPGNLFLAINVDTMVKVGTYSMSTGTLPSSRSCFMDSNGDFWMVGSTAGSSPALILTKWHPADGAAAGSLNVTVNTVLYSTIGIPSGQNIRGACFVPSNFSAFVACEYTFSGVTGDCFNIGLSSLAVNNYRADDGSFINSGQMSNAWFVQGVQPNGSLAIEGWNASNTRGIFEIIDPVNLTLTSSTDYIAQIIANPSLSPPPSSTNYAIGVGYKSTSGNYLLTYYSSSPVFLPLNASSTSPFMEFLVT